MSLRFKQRARGFLKEWVKPVVAVLIIVGSFRSAVADWNDVPTGSMKPTILVGERIFVNKLAYDLKVPFTRWRLLSWGDPDRADVVVLFSPADGKRLVKRVVGVPGDRVSLKDNRLFVNDVPASYQPLEVEVAELATDERQGYVIAREELGDSLHPVMFAPGGSVTRSFGPITVPPGHYFVMGDNRDNSLDSRWFGFVPRREIMGQATAVVASVDPEDRFRPRWRRFFRGLP